MNTELELRYSPASLRPARAWFLPGAGPAEWLRELTTWGVSLEEMRVIPLSQGGALAIPGKGAAEVSPHTVAALPYGVLGSRLYVPAEAVIEPPLSEAELRELLEEDLVYVWHPAQGLVRFSFEQALLISELLALPPLGNRIWDAAEPGIAENHRLISIAPASPITLEDVMEAGRDDIGKIPLAGGKLPPVPGEPQGGAIGRALKSAGLGALSGGAGLIAKAAKLLRGIGGVEGNAPQSAASGRNWLQRLADWATAQQQALNEDIDQLRNNQIERLLNLLKTSPDDGLAFALPLTGGADHRGLAAPSNYLPQRDVNFNLRHIGNGGPADFWNLPYNYQLALQQKYRELANREVSLGRHRRAAYILAELLGDLSAAAATLRDGGHYREAAVLFEKKLNQPLAAAQCLQRGGLLAEAIVIYERLEAWETIAEIHGELQQHEQAAAAWHRAVAKLLAGGDRLGAAKLLEEKLHLPEAAYEILWASWPTLTQARNCLDASFNLLARRGEHKRAEQQIRQLRGRIHVNSQLGDVTQCLAKLAMGYPEEQVRFVAADVTRRIAADTLPKCDESLSQVLLRSLSELVPGDKLLSRDCFRYRGQHAQKYRKIGSGISPVQNGRGPRLVTTIHLPDADWKAAVSIGSEYYALGVAAGKIVLIRGSWDGSIQHPVGDPWPISPQQADGKFLLAADPRGVSPLLVHIVPELPKRQLVFPIGESFPERLIAGTHPYAGPNTFGLGYSLGGGTTIANYAHFSNNPLDGFIFKYGPSGLLEGNQSLDISAVELESFLSEDFSTAPDWTRIYFERSGWHYGAMDRLVTIVGPKEGTVALPCKVKAITGSPPHTKPRIVFACEQGGAVLFGESAESTQTVFAQDLLAPVVGLNRGGYLIAATSHRVQVYRTSSESLPYVGESSCRGVEPIAILAHEQLNRFAVLAADGRMSCYDVNAG
jgi:hypothetical protein